MHSRKVEDPLFVKNLENVQGDERDVILFSIGYGPDEKGRISMNFGPINKAGGEKRLNVAFSRARITMMIFASLYSSDIKVTETSPEGLIAFRDFLKFAEGHDIQNTSISEAQAKLARAGILQCICEAISERGYQCDTMVGHSDFHVDIAVVDPFEPTKYMMGILLDGDGYRQTTNTRDREVAQIGVLKNLGWHLQRIWTIDWWDNRNKVLQNLFDMLDALHAESEKQFENEKAAKEARIAEMEAREAETSRVKAELETQAAEVIAEDEEAEAVQHTVQKAGAEPVAVDTDGGDTIAATTLTETAPVLEGKAVADVAAEPAIIASEAENADVTEDMEDNGENAEKAVFPEIHEVKIGEPTEYIEAMLPESTISQQAYADATNKKEIVERILAILSVEAPILKETLYRKVWASFGIKKSTTAIEATDKAFRAAKVKTTRQKGITFCWNSEQDPKMYEGIRVSNTRSGEEICPVEIKNAICYVLHTKGELDKDALVKETSLLFGYKRLGKNLEEILQTGLRYAKSSGAVVYLKGGLVSLPEKTEPTTEDVE